MSDWRYAKRDGHVVRWAASSQAVSPSDRRPEDLELLTTRGWVRVGRAMRWFLWRRARATTPEVVTRWLVRACCPTTPGDEVGRGARLRLRASLLLWLVSPPLPWGAPRMLASGKGRADEPTAVDVAEASFAASLRASRGDAEDRAAPTVGLELVEQARSGWDRAASRQASVESRANTFIQVAGLTTTVVLVNNSLVSGDNPVTGTSRSVFIGALILASASLLIAGLYGLYAVMRTFGRIAPDNETRVIERAQVPDDDTRRVDMVAALLLAQRRTSIVADWKLARLKRASLAFALAATAIAVASAAYLMAPPSS